MPSLPKLESLNYLRYKICVSLPTKATRRMCRGLCLQSWCQGFVRQTTIKYCPLKYSNLPCSRYNFRNMPIDDEAIAKRTAQYRILHHVVLAVRGRVRETTQRTYRRSNSTTSV